MAVPSNGMNASGMPLAATSDAASTSTPKLPPGRTSDIAAMPAARISSPPTAVR